MLTPRDEVLRGGKLAVGGEVWPYLRGDCWIVSSPALCVRSGVQLDGDEADVTRIETVLFRDDAPATTLPGKGLRSALAWVFSEHRERLSLGTRASLPVRCAGVVLDALHLGRFAALVGDGDSVEVVSGKVPVKVGRGSGVTPFVLLRAPTARMTLAAMVAGLAPVEDLCSLARRAA